MSWEEEVAPTLDDERSHDGSRLALLVFGDGPVRRYELPPSGELIIGRSPSSDVRITDPLASRYHARIRVGPGFTIEDLGSNNGTRLGEETIPPEETVPLNVGQVIGIGSALISLRRVPAREAPPASEVITDAKMFRVYELVDRYAAGEISVLVEGETGVGKELVAQAIHRRSPRVDNPYVCINCAALSEGLVESELFGHEKGAFTGADQEKMGLLEAASGGTVFLDEVGELPPGLQAKLLRVIENRELIRVGGLKKKAVDVRFVSATNRDLEAEVAAGRFRRDLYFRLAAARILVPPLRERPSEIEPMVRAFVRQAAAALGRPEPPIPDEVLEELAGRPWPGNVRELKNTIERGVLLGDLAGVEPFDARSEPGAVRREAAEGDDERSRILEALMACGGNQTKAAKMLGVSRRTLTNRLNQYKIPRPRKSTD